MPDVQNVFRRGAAYWWRRTLHWASAGGSPITLAFSLGTKDLGIARRRAAAMTVQNEVVRMSLYGRVASEGLTPDQRDAVLRTEMRAYRDGLDHLTAAWQANPAWAPVTATDADLEVYEAIWSPFAKTGVVDGKPSLTYAENHFDALTDEQRSGARNLLGAVDIRRSLTSETAQRLISLGIEPSATNMALAMRLILEARAQATRDLRTGIETVATPVALAPLQSVMPVTRVVPVAAITGVNAANVSESWRTITPVEAAERTM